MTGEKKALLELLLKKTKEDGWKWSGNQAYIYVGEHGVRSALFYTNRDMPESMTAFVGKQEYEQAVIEMKEMKMKEKKTAKELLQPGMFVVDTYGDVGIYVGNWKVVFHDNWLNIDNLDDDLKRGEYLVVSIYRVVDSVKGLRLLSQQWLQENATLVWQYESEEDKEKRMKKETLEEQMKKLQQEMDMLSQQISTL